MKHRVKGRKLKRTSSHKKALMANLSSSLIKSQRIHTTEAKAKELRLYIEPLVTKAKKAFLGGDSESAASVHFRRLARRFLRDDEAVTILFSEIAPKVAERAGGYTRVLKTGYRLGDGGATAIIEFVDFNYVEKKESKDNKEKKTKDSEAAEKPEAEKKKPAAKTKKAAGEVKAKDKTKKTPKKKDPEEGETKEKKTRKKKTEKKEA